MQRIAPAAVEKDQAFDFALSPLIFLWEMTQACDLACRHCRACAQPQPHPHELTTEQAMAVLEDLRRFPRPPLLVLTGGDPLKRADIYEIAAQATRMGLRVAMTPSATNLVTHEALLKLKQAGVARLAVSIDGCDAPTHDGMRGVAGCFDRSMEILAEAAELGLGTQINTTVSRRNAHQVDAMADLFGTVGIDLWSVFFLVPIGRGRVEAGLGPAGFERVFERLFHHALTQRYAIKTTEAPHYRRFVAQRAEADGHNPRSIIKTAGVNDGQGVMFLSHTGQIHPSGFLPINCGQFPRDSVVDVYQRHPMFQQLRQPSRLGGKCGACEFNAICGGSRARAYAVSGDPLAEEPSCAYVPVSMRRKRRCTEHQLPA